MVAPRLGAAGLQPRGAPGVPLQTAGMETRSQAHHLRDGAAARRWLAHQKIRFKAECSPVGDVVCAERASGPPARPPGGTRAERRGRRESAAQDLGRTARRSPEPVRAAESIPEGLWPRLPSGELETWPRAWLALCQGPCLSSQPNLTSSGADVPCQAPPNPLPAMRGLESQSKHQHGPSTSFNIQSRPAPARGGEPSATRGAGAAGSGARRGCGRQTARGRAAGRRPVARRTPTRAQWERLPIGRAPAT